MADNKDEVIISKLKIKIGGETKDLTIEQAKKLYQALGELFAEPRVRVEKEYVYWPFRTWVENRMFAPNWIYTTSGNDTSKFTQCLSLEVK